MKKLLLLFCVFSFINLSFVSCGSDEDDETFVTNDAQAKEMIKGGQWTIKSIKLESNYSEFDKSMNESFVQSIQENILTMVFDGEYVVSTTTPKKSNNIVPNTREKYYFENNSLYVEDVDIKMTLRHSYKISEKTLVMTGDFTRDILVKTFEIDGIINGVDYTDIINAIPQNFSGKLIYTLKK